MIMDGNGRWAVARGRARISGHRAGVEALRRIVESAPELGVTTLTVYAFSADNWGRPPAEVRGLMRLFARYLADDIPQLVEKGVRLRFIGRRDRLSPALVASMERAERDTAGGTTLSLRVAIDYSARDAILEAARRLGAAPDPSRDAFCRALGGDAGDVDLLVRTGGEQRLSDFLLWECAYAELWFTNVAWPDFGPEHLANAIADFRRRDRRFGRVSTAVG